MSRKLSREKAMELVFSMMLSGDNHVEAVETFVDNYEDNIEELELDYIKEVLKGVEENKTYIDELLEKNLQNWKLNRISKVNLAILRLATYEMKFRDDVPDRVALNEALDLTKKYSDYKSKTFVNGVLDKILNEK
ncbi:MAG: transcription antitermination factor NusB [Clostridium sp.]|uniref:transcription antitermination factor NusB n=1 Tax=Clostridium sp. TaxID=1506 RepID=UPI003EE7E4EA